MTHTPPMLALALMTMMAACAREPGTPIRALAPNAPAPVRPVPTPLPAPSATLPAPQPPPPPLPAPAPAYPFEEPLPGPVLPASAPAVRNADLSPAACRSRMRADKLPLASAHIATPGVATPVRITGRIEGVRFVTPHAPSPYGVLDCRLALALRDFSRLLSRHGVTTVYVDNFYRPHAHLPGKHKPSQHAYGLAIDLMGLTFSDGTTLRVGADWHGAIGHPTCGPGSAPEKATPGALELRKIVCDVARAGIFIHMLTPDYNAAHRTHFHFDIARGATYRFVK